MKGNYFGNWYVICTSEQTHFPTKMCDHATNKKPVLEARSRTKEEKEEKVRKQRCTMTFPTKEEVNFNLLSGLKLLTCHPMAKSQGAILKVS